MGQPGALILNPTAIAHQEPSAAAARRLRRVLHRARRRRRRRLPLGVAAIRPARTRFLQMLCFLELCASCCIQSFSSGEFGIQRWGIQHSFFFFCPNLVCTLWFTDRSIDRLSMWAVFSSAAATMLEDVSHLDPDNGKLLLMDEAVFNKSQVHVFYL